MTDETQGSSGTEPNQESAGAPPAETAKEPSGGWEPAEEPGSGRAHEWLVQLQQMIDRVAAEAAPVARDIAAKAAELAAVAGEKAGPVARRAAEITGDAGTKVAERSRRFADDVRHRGAESGSPPTDAPVGPEAETSSTDAPDAPVPEEPPA